MNKILKKRTSANDIYNPVFDQPSFNEIFEKDKQEIITILINKKKSKTFCQALRIEGKEFKIVTFDDQIKGISLSTVKQIKILNF